MRKWYVFSVLVVVALAWWASPRTAAQEAQMFTGLGLQIGEHVTLLLDKTNESIECEVAGVRGPFIACARRNDSDRESWYNLQFVTRITKRAK